MRRIRLVQYGVAEEELILRGDDLVCEQRRHHLRYAAFRSYNLTQRRTARAERAILGKSLRTFLLKSEPFR